MSPITPDDHALYQSFFARAPGAAVYANSWAYITQACRGIGEGLGMKYIRRDALYAVGSHRGHFVVVNPLGDLQYLPNLVAELRRASSRPVFVKKLQPARSALNGLIPARASYFGGRQPAPGRYLWDSTAYADDDTYPEQIVNVDLALRFTAKPSDWFDEYRTLSNGLSSVDANSIRHAYRQFRRCVGNAGRLSNEARVVEFDLSLLDNARRFVHEYFGDGRPNAADAYTNILAGLDRRLFDGSQFCYVVTTGSGQVISGLILAERLGPGSAGIYMRLIPRRMPGLPEYAMAQVLDRLRKAGIETVNLGGSETLGLHVFKQKLAPIEERLFPVFVYGVPRETADADHS